LKATRFFSVSVQPTRERLAPQRRPRIPCLHESAQYRDPERRTWFAQIRGLPYITDGLQSSIPKGGIRQIPEKVLPRQQDRIYCIKTTISVRDISTPSRPSAVKSFPGVVLSSYEGRNRRSNPIRQFQERQCGSPVHAGIRKIDGSASTGGPARLAETIILLTSHPVRPRERLFRRGDQCRRSWYRETYLKDPTDPK